MQGFGRPLQSEATDVSNMRGPPLDPSVAAEAKAIAYPQVVPSQDRSQPNGFQNDPPHDLTEEAGPMIQDPLPGMSDRDRYGLKGLLSMLKGPYPDQAALITGVDITTLGFDLNSTE